MSYETYTTDALVCGTFHRNTADCSYLLFTRSAGMLYADTRSARKESSRQRYALQDFSLLRVSLVKGKRGWRVGSIEPRKNYYDLAVDQAARGSVVSMVRLLRRFLRGEEESSDLFDYCIDALDTLTNKCPERQFVELVVQAQVLARLGYVDETKIPTNIKGIAPGEISSKYGVEVEQQISSLHTHAVSMSHL